MKTKHFIHPILALIFGLISLGQVIETAHAQPNRKPQTSQSVDRVQDNVRAEIVDGRVRITVKEDPNKESTDSYFIDGLQGRCVGLFVGDIGQDTNPFLCMLMDDGGVEFFAYSAIDSTHPYFHDKTVFSSGRLPDMHNIVGFREGPVINEYDFAEYTSIFAIDRQGSEYEIVPCTYPESEIYYYPNSLSTASEYRLAIYPHGVFTLTESRSQNDDIGQYTGRFNLTKTDYDNDIYEYRYKTLSYRDYTKASDKAESTQAKPVTHPQSGTFRLTSRHEEEDYEMTILSGDPKFFGGEPGSPVHYSPVRRDADE